MAREMALAELSGMASDLLEIDQGPIGVMLSSRARPIARFCPRFEAFFDVFLAETDLLGDGFGMAVAGDALLEAVGGAVAVEVRHQGIGICRRASSG